VLLDVQPFILAATLCTLCNAMSCHIRPSWHLY